MQRSVGWSLRAGAGLALALALACGSEEASRPSGAAMAASEPAAEREGNRPPRIERVRIEPERPLPGQTLRALVEASDPDGDPVRLRYAWTVEGRPAGEGRSPTLEAEFAKDERVEVSVVASDGRGESTATATARVRNRPPVLHGVYLSVEEEVDSGDRVLAGPEASDPDGDPLEFEYAWLVNGEPVEEPEGRVFPAEGVRRGDRIQVRVVAYDGEDRSHPVTSPAVRVGNSAPEIAGLPEPRREDGTFHYDFEARDPDGDAQLRFRLAQAPEGMTIDPVLGVATWRPELSQVGSHPVEVVVTDGHGAESTFRFDVTVDAEEEAAGAEGAPPPAAPAPEGS